MKIAIAGYGLEGEANYRYFAKDVSNEITIFDQFKPTREIPQGAKVVIGEDVFEQLNGFDLVVRTSGLAPYKIKTDGKIWSGTNEFFARCPAQIIGVTGSKGKGTTVSLVTSILKKAGRKVWLVGNIGVPSLDVLAKIRPSDIVVFELSSFQLWDLEKSPSIATVLYIELEHQDIHKSMDDYLAAKANITKHQSQDDMLIYNVENEYARKIAKKTKAHLIGYPSKKSAHVKNGYFWYGEQKICSVRELKIAGVFNQDNTCAAIDIAWQFTQNIKTIGEGIAAFHGLPHRLELIREYAGVKYYDDSIATIPGAAVAALKSFAGHKVAILGGSYKGSDFSDLAVEVKRQDADVVLIGAEAERIAEAFDQVGAKRYEIMSGSAVTMDMIVARAQQLANPGDTVLLSPAAASFGMFKNYVDRGNQFQAAVNKLGKKE